MTSNLISVKGVSKVFKVGEENFTALRDINLEIDGGSFMSFVGPSGSGKTTILNLIGGLDVPTAGNIFFQNTKLSSMNRNQMAQYRRKNIGFIFQTYNLFPVYSVYENILLLMTFFFICMERLVAISMEINQMDGYTNELIHLAEPNLRLD